MYLRQKETERRRREKKYSETSGILAIVIVLGILIAMIIFAPNMVNLVFHSNW